MDLDFSELIENNKDENTKMNCVMEDVESDLANKLDAIEEYTIDRFEGDFAVCENRKTREMINIERIKLPSNVYEGSIIKYVNGRYFLDKESTKNIEKVIEEKMKGLWN